MENTPVISWDLSGDYCNFCLNIILTFSTLKFKKYEIIGYDTVKLDTIHSRQDGAGLYFGAGDFGPLSKSTSVLMTYTMLIMSLHLT
jgi:hypothetical protein